MVLYSSQQTRADLPRRVFPSLSTVCVRRVQKRPVQKGVGFRECVTAPAPQPEDGPPHPSPFDHTNAGLRTDSVQRAASKLQALDPGFAEAFQRPAMKTAPAHFHSIEAAEQAGWSFSVALGRWEAPKEQLEAYKALERRVKLLTPERLEAMGVEELRQALQLTAGSATGAEPPADEEGLRRHVAEEVAGFKKKCRMVRTQQLSEAASDAGATRLPVNVCKACTRLPAVGKKLYACARCQSVSYCDAKCQKKDWASHKAYCKIAAKAREKGVTGQNPMDPNKFKEVMAWYGSVPGLAEQVICQAWQHRGKSPFIQVQGGLNARMAEVEVTPRSQWGQLGEKRDTIGFAARYAQADFDPDAHYFVVISAGHAGTDDWPCPTPRCRFPLPPEKMDAWVVAANERREAARRASAEQQASNPWVRLVGLRNEALNTATGIRGAWDQEKERWTVQLTSGQQVSVKPENIELMH
ncbi:hypothetical protein CYMTET_9451 [Cymbomonas tetramitiformis]|uniref:MYND-type domain-containing protein n=1 Tax=Cymbomonas tetramitiformis TaxID=36881 RepID=A0AAE0LEV0_9CHLO|nr:hypothetical protein CYMTET_9451 [Cymbomonas tetramitiformis]